MSDESILDSVKKVVNINKDDTSFDTDIVLHINSVFATLHQLGVGPEQGFQIEDSDALWEDFLLGDPRLNSIKTYVCLRVRMLFDPPMTSYHATAIQEQIKELEWRLSTQRETSRVIPN